MAKLVIVDIDRIVNFAFGHGKGKQFDLLLPLSKRRLGQIVNWDTELEPMTLTHEERQLLEEQPVELRRWFGLFESSGLAVSELNEHLGDDEDRDNGVNKASCQEVVDDDDCLVGIMAGVALATIVVGVICWLYNWKPAPLYRE